MGAVAIKNSVYVAPRTDDTQEDFEWLLREIVKGGGDASMCEARFIEGLKDDRVEALFNAARESDYRQIAEEVRSVEEALPRRPEIVEDQRADVEADVARLNRRLADVIAIDFFGAPGREAAEGLLAGLEARLRRRGAGGSSVIADRERIEDLRGRTWVTRKGIHIDRIASAWLIRRVVDPDARFKFVAGKGYRPEHGELRFDMFEAEFTHEGDLCTFEVLRARLAIDDPAMRPIAEIVHDIDLKDEKFGRPEASGIDRLIAPFRIQGWRQTKLPSPWATGMTSPGSSVGPPCSRTSTPTSAEGEAESDARIIRSGLLTWRPRPSRPRLIGAPPKRSSPAR